MLRRRRQAIEQTKVIDERRWSRVEPFMNLTESPIENTPAKMLFSKGTEDGFLFLTDQALIFYSDKTSLGLRVPFEAFEAINSPGGSKVTFNYRTGDDSGAHVSVEVYPSPISQKLLDDVVSRVSTLRP